MRQIYACGHMKGTAERNTRVDPAPVSSPSSLYRHSQVNMDPIDGAPVVVSKSCGGSADLASLARVVVGFGALLKGFLVAVRALVSGAV